MFILSAMLVLFGCAYLAQERSEEMGTSSVVTEDQSTASINVDSPSYADIEGPSEEFEKRTLKLRFDDSDSLELSSSRRWGKTPTSPTQCRVKIGSSTLTTIGVGYFEALQCLNLIEAGALKADNNNKRIGLIYRTASPNFVGRTPIVLRQADSKEWIIDPISYDGSGRMNDSAQTIAELSDSIE